MLTVVIEIFLFSLFNGWNATLLFKKLYKIYLAFELLHGRRILSHFKVIFTNADNNYAFKLFNISPLCAIGSADWFCFIAFVNVFADCIERVWQSYSISASTVRTVFSFLFLIYTRRYCTTLYKSNKKIKWLMFVLESCSDGENIFSQCFSKPSNRKGK